MLSVYEFSEHLISAMFKNAFAKKFLNMLDGGDRGFPMTKMHSSPLKSLFDILFLFSWAIKFVPSRNLTPNSFSAIFMPSK
jgi:hypothetical protein